MTNETDGLYLLRIGTFATALDDRFLAEVDTETAVTQTIEKVLERSVLSVDTASMKEEERAKLLAVRAYLEGANVIYGIEGGKPVSLGDEAKPHFTPKSGKTKEGEDVNYNLLDIVLSQGQKGGF